MSKHNFRLNYTQLYLIRGQNSTAIGMIKMSIYGFLVFFLCSSLSATVGQTANHKCSASWTDTAVVEQAEKKKEKKARKTWSSSLRHHLEQLSRQIPHITREKTRFEGTIWPSAAAGSAAWSRPKQPVLLKPMLDAEFILNHFTSEIVTLPRTEGSCN